MAFEQKVTFHTKTGLNSKVKRVAAVFHDPSKQGGESEKDLYSLNVEIKRLCEEWGTEEVSMTLPQGIPPEKLRKMVETIFHDTSITVTLRALRGELKARGRPLNNRGGTAIIVDVGETTYADTLKKLREDIQDEEVLKEIKKVRKTVKGDLLLTVTEHGEKVRKKVVEVLKDRKVKIAGNRKEKLVHIRDIDAVTTQDDIVTALQHTGVVTEKAALKVKSLRPTVAGNQIATVALAENDAAKILEIGRLRLGLTMCRIEERVEVERCYRCWGFGHRSSSCRGEDRANRCQRCTGEGHQRSTCEAEPYCPLCEAKGHQAGSGRCLEFRKALKNTRARTRRISTSP